MAGRLDDLPCYIQAGEWAYDLSAEPPPLRDYQESCSVGGVAYDLNADSAQPPDDGLARWADGSVYCLCYEVACSQVDQGICVADELACDLDDD